MLPHAQEHTSTSQYNLMMVRSDARNYKDVPDDQKTPELNMLAVEIDARNYKDVPDNQKTQELTNLAVDKDARNYEHVPDAQKTPELAESAVRRDGRNWTHVPEEQKTEELENLARQSIETMFSSPVFAAAYRSVTENIPMEKNSSGEWVEGSSHVHENTRNIGSDYGHCKSKGEE